MTSRSRKKRPATPKSANPVQTRQTQAGLGTLFWEKVEKDFRGWESFLQDVAVPTSSEIDRYQASLVPGGKIKSNLKHRLHAGDIIYPGDEERRRLVADAINEVRNKKRCALIEAAIKDKDFSEEFFWAWTHYQKNAAIIVALEIADGTAVKDFQQKTAQRTNILQNYIYSFWMYRRWAKKSGGGERQNKDARGEAETKLARKIHLVLKRDDFSLEDRKTLKGLITYEGKDPVLKGQVLNFSAAKICDFVEQGGVRQDELPQIGY